jgi:hypothetical protein
MVPSKQDVADASNPPDEWLLASDSERGAHEGRVLKVGGEKFGSAAYDKERPEEWRLTVHTNQPLPPALSRLDAADQLAGSLDPFDRMRLIARLWASLAPSERATLLTIGLDKLSRFPSEQSAENAVKVKPSPIWRFLFDRENTSELYSAPRQFDLATVFVILTAYSLLFAALTFMDQLIGLELQPLLTIVIGFLVTVVAIGQAWYFHEANPRGVSVVVGAVAYTVVSIVLWMAYPRTFPNSFLFVFLINGLIGGAVFGYCAGALVGGIFLVADVLRQKISANGVNAAPTRTEDELNDDLESGPVSQRVEN